MMTKTIDNHLSDDNEDDNVKRQTNHGVMMTNVWLPDVKADIDDSKFHAKRHVNRKIIFQKDEGSYEEEKHTRLQMLTTTSLQSEKKIE